jgi:uncharacterized protein YndB with AHSA1/START domain
MRITLLLVALALTASSATADVLESVPAGFTVRVSARMAAPPARIYRALTEAISAWWDKAHTYSGDAMNLSLNATPGGCFCEKLPSGGGVRHLTVVYADPGKMLRLSGGLGPLQDFAVDGTMTWRFVEVADGTTVELTYRVGGYVTGGIGNLAAPVNTVLTEQMARLKQFVEMSR